MTDATNHSIVRTGTSARWSDTVCHNGTAYMVEVPTRLNVGISAQTDEVLSSLEASLDIVGSSKSHLLLVTIYLADIREIDAFNALWDIWVPSGTAPVRACIQAKLANPGYRVELQVIAALVR